MTRFEIEYTLCIVVPIDAQNEEDAIESANQYIDMTYTDADLRTHLQITNIRESE